MYDAAASGTAVPNPPTHLRIQAHGKSRSRRAEGGRVEPYDAAVSCTAVPAPQPPLSLECMMQRCLAQPCLLPLSVLPPYAVVRELGHHG